MLKQQRFLFICNQLLAIVTKIASKPAFFREKGRI
jgi:hypothetical protein